MEAIACSSGGMVLSKDGRNDGPVEDDDELAVGEDREPAVVAREGREALCGA